MHLMQPARSCPLLIDHDAPARIDLNTDIFEVEAFDVWPAADGDEHNIGFELYKYSITLPDCKRENWELRTVSCFGP